MFAFQDLVNEIADDLEMAKHDAEAARGEADDLRTHLLHISQDLRHADNEAKRATAKLQDARADACHLRNYMCGLLKQARDLKAANARLRCAHEDVVALKEACDGLKMELQETRAERDELREEHGIMKAGYNRLMGAKVRGFKRLVDYESDYDSEPEPKRAAPRT
jgi:predicted  nucleic acid-binding Zn-ribbon protein